MNDYNVTSEPKSNIFSIGEHVFFPLENGQLLSIRLSDGNLAWQLEGAHYERFGHIDNKIYTIGNYNLAEIDSNSGKILREVNINDIFETGFRPTGEIIAYDEYIFCLSTSKEGQIAIYDRKSFQLKEVLRVGELVPYGKENLMWHEGRLYILDFAKTLHICE